MRLRQSAFLISALSLAFIVVTLVFFFHVPAKSGLSSLPPPGGQESEVTPPSSGTMFIFGHGLVASKSAAAVRYIHQDLLGTNRFSENDRGQLESKTTFSPYGTTVSKESYSQAKPKFTFTGKEDEGSLIYFGARYYDARVARFDSTDPSGDGGYDYADDNPLTKIDPDGRKVVVRLTASPAGMTVPLKPLQDQISGIFRTELVKGILGVDVESSSEIFPVDIGVVTEGSGSTNYKKMSLDASDVLMNQPGTSIFYLSQFGIDVVIHEMRHSLDLRNDPQFAIVNKIIKDGGQTGIVTSTIEDAKIYLSARRKLEDRGYAAGQMYLDAALARRYVNNIQYELLTKKFRDTQAYQTYLFGRMEETLSNLNYPDEQKIEWNPDTLLKGQVHVLGEGGQP